MFEDIYSTILDKLSYGLNVVLISVLSPKTDSSGDILYKIILDDNDISNNSFPNELENLRDSILESLKIGKPLSIEHNSKLYVIEPFYSKPRLIVFGGGHIAEPLAKLAYESDFSVTIVDDRPMFANANRFPDADNIICDSFKNALSNIVFRKTDFVTIITRGHKHDDLCLREALKYDLAYLGMIGSKRRTNSIIKSLLEDGYDSEKVDSLNSPIGLNIGAVTPFEIAVSIVAEIIKFRRLSEDSSFKFNWPEFDRDVLLEIDNNTNKALVTILSSKGSVPRKAGAKMLVYSDGRLTGSIGGGCSEGDIILKARDLISTKSYSIEFVDMTGEIAENSGMVCGGVMNVIIEAF